MTILKRESEYNQTDFLKKRVQSDHLALITSVSMQPMISIRTPAINKNEMIAKIENLSRKQIAIIRTNPSSKFMEIRNSLIRNQPQVYRIIRENEGNRIQTRLKVNILEFRKHMLLTKQS